MAKPKRRDYYRQHQNLIKRFKLLASTELPEARFFDRHVGQFFTKTGQQVKINEAGMSDLYGIIKTENGLIHIEVEAKTGGGRLSAAQLKWKHFITEIMGGKFYLLRDEKETIDNIKNDLYK